MLGPKAIRSSHGQTKLPGRVFLRSVRRHEALDLFRSVKPERGSKMSEVERPWRGHGRQHVGLAGLQGEIAEEKQLRVLLDPVEAGRSSARSDICLSFPA